MAVKSLRSVLAALIAASWGLIAPARAEDAVPAVIPLEVLAIDPQLAVGAITSSGFKVKWPIVARQPARAARAVVLEKGKGKVLALALLGKLETTPEGKLMLDVAAASQAWCEFGSFMSTYVDCYQDLDADGKFETQRLGALGSNEAVALRRVLPAKPITAIGYRAANEAEIPKFEVGYVSCMGAGVDLSTLDSPLRFGTFINRTDDSRMSDEGACKDIAKPLGEAVDNERVFQFGRFKVAVRAKSDSELTTRLLEGIPAGTLLGHLRSGSPIVDATEVSPDTSAIIGDTPFLRMKGDAQIAAAAKAGEEFFSVQVEHGLTGTLMVELKSRGWSAPKIVPAGTPLYGIAMSSNMVARSLDPEIVWCAPVRDAKQKLIARCAAHIFGNSYGLHETDWTPYVVTTLSGDGNGIDSPVVERGPVSFGAPLFLKLRYQNTDKKWVSYEWSVAPGDERIWKSMGSRRARDNAGFVLLGEAVLKLAPSADGTTISVSTEIGKFEPGNEISLPQDPVQLR